MRSSRASTCSVPGWAGGCRTWRATSPPWNRWSSSGRWRGRGGWPGRSPAARAGPAPPGVDVRIHPAEGYAAEGLGGEFAILDVRLTPELVAEGRARELVHQVQQMRKDAGLDLADRIVLFVEGDAGLDDLLRDHGAYLRRETLAVDLQRRGAPGGPPPRGRRRPRGVAGGWGPGAPRDFFEKVPRPPPARRDQEHLRLIIDNNPKIPDRGPAILGDGEDPTPALVATARNVEAAGADLIVIPCNTAHYFYQAIQAAVRVPVLHIMQEVAGAASRRVPRLRRVVLLATGATVATGLYQDAFRPLGAEVVVPDERGQEVIDRLIYAIKAQGVDDALRSAGVAVGRGLNRAGAEALILGCTELPLALGEDPLGLPILDSNLILAEVAVRLATSTEPLPAPVRV